MERRLIIGKEVWRIITIYSKEIENTKKNLEKVISETDSSKVVIRGDWNARIEENGTENGGEEEDGRRRRSKDKVKNEEGKKMVEENGWWKLNENREKNEEGKWTYLGPRENSVIDYAVVSAITKRDIAEFKVKKKVESDHMLIKVKAETLQELELRTEKENWKELKIWTKEK